MASNGGYIDPIFTSWSPPMAQALTNWIFADKQSNPLYDKPAEWGGAGQVVFADRSLNILSLANGATATLPLNLGGGKNVLLFSRVCSVVPTAPAGPNAVVLPNQIHSYVLVQQERQDGLIEIETTPISNVFGFGWSPHVLPFPEKWQGNQQRSLVVANASGVTVNVRFSWKIAYLHTGR